MLAVRNQDDGTFENPARDSFVFARKGPRAESQKACAHLGLKLAVQGVHRAPHGFEVGYGTAGSEMAAAETSESKHAAQIGDGLFLESRRDTADLARGIVRIMQ